MREMWLKLIRNIQNTGTEVFMVDFLSVQFTNLRNKGIFFEIY